MSTIFAIAGGQRILRYFIMRSLSRQPRQCGGQSTARHARAQASCQVVASDTRRVIYDARAFRELRAERDARTKGWERGPHRGPLKYDPLAATSRPARHDTRRRQGEAKHDTAQDSGGRARGRDRGGGVRRLHVAAESDEREHLRERAEHGQPGDGDRHDAEHPADASRESEPWTEALDVRPRERPHPRTGSDPWGELVPVLRPDRVQPHGNREPRAPFLGTSRDETPYPLAGDRGAGSERPPPVFSRAPNIRAFQDPRDLGSRTCDCTRSAANVLCHRDPARPPSDSAIATGPRRSVNARRPTRKELSRKAGPLDDCVRMGCARRKGWDV